MCVCSDGICYVDCRIIGAHDIGGSRMVSPLLSEGRSMNMAIIIHRDGNRGVYKVRVV